MTTTPIQANAHAYTDEAVAAQLAREARARRTPRKITVEGKPLAEARSLRDELGDYIDRSTPLGEDSLKVFEIFAEVAGQTVAEVAARLGIDLATASMADGRRLSWYYGTRAGDKHSAGQR